MHLAIFQTARLDLEFLQRNLDQIPKGALCLFPEYVLSPFFLDLLKSEPQHIVNQAHTRQAQLEALARQRSVHFAVPTLTLQEQGLYKQMAWISPNHTHYYTQQRLIAFDHWDERAFFANPQKALQMPLNFVLEDIKIALLFGYELHFDALWLTMQENGVDMVLLSTASTFESFERWRAVCSARAFCNSMLVARANRVGLVRQEYYQENKCNLPWRFYGDSFIALPNAQIVDSLQGQEGVLHLEIHKEYLDAWAREWGFRTPQTHVGEIND
ncbi:carbon-nitrogen hydrolase family protein [Helicobacter baculiformis]|uniref:Carbon-nitrogen hydrolase family protein n=1 Tax=Helicobacter baculiformis TaxID=427351 RepID=A0ABV7ZL35_9HELI|nr:carbon-nitrogen hydrolase family protein [Helicobacter baculiformis]